MSSKAPIVNTPNPFCTRFIRPGAVEYLFVEDLDAAGLVGRLRSNGWLGEIVGPHGSGKSALIASLDPEIRRLGMAPLLVELHDGQRRLPLSLKELLDGETPQKKLLIIDGYEQLGFWARWKLRRFCRRHGIGLLVSSHKSQGFPELYCTRPTLDLAERVVARLSAGSAHDAIPRDVLQDAYRRHDGNIREMFFDLYDFIERVDGRIGR